jgi:membrane associated rhomboid family serine protease
MAMNQLSPVCLVVGLYWALLAGRLFIMDRAGQPARGPVSPLYRFPLATALLALAISVPTTLQFFFPIVLSALRRDYARFLAGDWWRLITPLFVQDTGLAGACFNIVTLLLVGATAEKLWGARRKLVIFFVGALVGEVVGFAWQPIGAGNSVGNSSLAASMASVCLLSSASRKTQFCALRALSADALLLVLKDIHGAARQRASCWRWC